MTQSLADMRREYTRDGLSEANAPSDPFSLFRQWFDDAVKTERLPVEPNAMTLATVDADGYPHCRILLLKGLDERGFTFFTNYESAKGQQLAANPRAAMTFFWPALERQVRIEGSVEKVTPEESAAYYQVRPLGSRLGAWASPQSRVIADRAELERLQFRQVTDSKGASRYARTIRVCGQRYTRPSGMKDDYRFETPIPVTISSTVTQRSSNVSGAVGRAIVTPFTAAVDIVTLPIVLPFAVFALKDMKVGF